MQQQNMFSHLLTITDYPFAKLLWSVFGSWMALFCLSNNTAFPQKQKKPTQYKLRGG